MVIRTGSGCAKRHVWDGAKRSTGELVLGPGQLFRESHGTDPYPYHYLKVGYMSN